MGELHEPAAPFPDADWAGVEAGDRVRNCVVKNFYDLGKVVRSRGPYPNGAGASRNAPISCWARARRAIGHAGTLAGPGEWEVRQMASKGRSRAPAPLWVRCDSTLRDAAALAE